MNDAGKVAFTPKGVYDNTATYEYLDAVQYNGNCYCAKKTTTGNPPPTTEPYADDNWAVLVVGGASVPMATIDIAGLVKAGDDIGVDSTGEMILKTDFTAQEELAELTGTEDRQTFFGKIAKAVSTLISHIGTSATANKAGHVKLSNSSAVTDSTGLALPATEKNAALEGTMANQIDTLNKSFEKSGAIHQIGTVSDEEKTFDCSEYKTITVVLLLANAVYSFMDIPIEYLADNFRRFAVFYFYDTSNYANVQIDISKTNYKLGAKTAAAGLTVDVSLIGKY